MLGAFEKTPGTAICTMRPSLRSTAKRSISFQPTINSIDIIYRFKQVRPGISSIQLIIATVVNSYAQTIAYRCSFLSLAILVLDDGGTTIA
ncbi:MAG: hypothetical protein CV082_00455 [Candidatus Brocadia sp. BL1]|nr:MAG: hypothetical protein CV082_00455 [Candidatus Brocadia sp. BL1]